MVSDGSRERDEELHSVGVMVTISTGRGNEVAEWRSIDKRLEGPESSISIDSSEDGRNINV